MKNTKCLRLGKHPFRIALFIVVAKVMRILYNQPGQKYSTFRLPANLAQVYLVERLSDLKDIPLTPQPIIIGEGSNTIFLASQQRPLLQFQAKQCVISAETDTTVFLHVEAGHNWHQLVCWAVEHNLWGIENLALIPGSVGAAPIQNIGAYGVEFADVCEYVDFYSWQDQSIHRKLAKDCHFAYRDSVFKQALSGKGLVVAVGVRLSKIAKPVLAYAGLDTLTDTADLKTIFTQVITTRQAKLPDYNTLANCGSFFKNPVISQAHYNQLKASYPTIPGYSSEKHVKVPAAWLIDQLGFKGYRQNDVGCYNKQPLVLVNYGEGKATNLLSLVAMIQSKVAERYAIQLEPEVRLLDADGKLHVQS